eukprot:3491856-Amphidinium_carterae.1
MSSKALRTKAGQSTSAKVLYMQQFVPKSTQQILRSEQDETNGVDWDLSRVSSPSLVPSVAGCSAWAAVRIAKRRKKEWASER